LKKKTVEFDIGNTVVCDLCDENYTNSDAVGGFVFESKGVCPKCASMAEIVGYGFRRTRRPNATEREAACLLMLKRGDGSWLIPPELRNATAAEICKAVQYQHEDYFALSQSHDPRMLTPMRPEDHKEITAKVDIPRIAKIKRSSKKQEEFRRKMLAKGGGEDEAPPVRRKAKIASRPFPKTQKGFRKKQEVDDDGYC
jgi:hypothetical protein